MKLAPYDDIESLQRYSQEISKYPLLSPEKEKELVIRASKGDLEARAKLINSNLRLVVYEARRFLYSGLPLLDLISEGNIGLIRAVDHSNPKYKNKFSTYARYWIKQAITQAIRDKVEPVHFPTLFYNKKKRLEHIIYSKSNVTSTLEKSLLDKSEFSKDFLLLYSPFHGGVGSLNSPIAQDLEVLDVVPSKYDFIGKLEENIVSPQIYAQVKEILNPVQFEVIKYRFGLDNSKVLTLEQIGKKFNITRERVRQIEKEALSKLAYSFYNKFDI